MWPFKKSFPFHHQLDSMDCGPSCLRMVTSFYGQEYSTEYLRDNAFIGKQGVSLSGINDAAEKIGMHATAVKTPYSMLKEERPFPCILHWRKNHFIVLFDIKAGKVQIADPAKGLVTLSEEDFLIGWLGQGTQKLNEGFALLLKPTPFFGGLESENKKITISFFIKYLKPYKNLFAQISLALFVGSGLSILMPILTQALVDKGINEKNIGFVYLVLIAQVMLFLGRTTVEVIKGWILLHLSTRIDISIISDFFIKLMRLPISFFDSKNLGDILQRIRDHNRIKQFLTGTSPQTLFSVLNLIVLSFVMLNYSTKVYLLFIFGSILYVIWIIVFLKRRKEIDYLRFKQSSTNQSTEIQLIQGMQEIKLNGAEKQKRWEWENVQVNLFKVNIKSLLLEQYQSIGGNFINELKNILITFWAAKEVINGDITLGMMMAITQIVGQLNAPIMQFIGFIRAGQDAKISLERLSEIHNKPNEDENEREQSGIPMEADIDIKNLSFRYGGPNDKYVLQDINMTIPYGKTTAIVGFSGSGKTTLLKLLLKFYEPQEGEILINETPLKNINSKTWRSKCGTVMQDGFMFSDTIGKNIAITEEGLNLERLMKATEIANIQEFILDLPLKFETKIGSDGIGLSQGQKQRIMIARAAYKHPEYLLFDEATSALDSSNEATITNNLQKYSQGKTSIIIAHRLSTVKNADQIIVLDRGTIMEQGTHSELIDKRDIYFNLVKDQIDIGQ